MHNWKDQWEGIRGKKIKSNMQNKIFLPPHTLYFGLKDFILHFVFCPLMWDYRCLSVVVSRGRQRLSVGDGAQSWVASCQHAGCGQSSATCRLLPRTPCRWQILVVIHLLLLKFLGCGLNEANLQQCFDKEAGDRGGDLHGFAFARVDLTPGQILTRYA